MEWADSSAVLPLIITITIIIRLRTVADVLFILIYYLNIFGTPAYMICVNIIYLLLKGLKTQTGGLGTRLETCRS